MYYRNKDTMKTDKLCWLEWKFAQDQFNDPIWLQWSAFKILHVLQTSRYPEKNQVIAEHE